MTPFLALWQTESAVTRRVLEALRDEMLDDPVLPGGRSPRQLAWHLVTAVGDIARRAGFPIGGPSRHDPAPGRVGEIVEAYRTAAADLAEAMTGAAPECLDETVDVYGETWSVRSTLHVLLAHEIHHRGQLALALRAAGLAVPAIYGPSADDPGRGWTPPVA